jgi:hypothetical protein
MPRMRSAGTSTRSVPSFSTAAQSFRRAELVSISRGENYSFSISAKLAKAGARPTQPCTASAMPSPKEAMCKSSPIGDAPLGGSLGEVVAERWRLGADPPRTTKIRRTRRSKARAMEPSRRVQRRPPPC